MPLFKSKSRIFIASLPFITARTTAFIFLGVCVFFIAVSTLKPDLDRMIRAFVADIFAPVIKAISVPVQSASLAMSDMVNISNLQAENIRLKEENERLKEWYQTALVLESDNKALRTLLNVHPDPQQSFMSARVMSDSSNRFVKTLLVSVGKKDGIKKFQAVVTGDGLVGRVIEVGHSATRILLLTDISSKVPVLVAGTNQHAIVSGDNTDLLTLDYLDKESPVRPGMKIITSGHGNVFPPGIAVGEVIVTENNELRVKLFHNMKHIVYVRILDFAGNHNLQNLIDGAE